MPAPTTALKADLKMIGDAIKRADGVPDTIKSLLGEIVAWNEAMTEHAQDLDERVEASEAAIDEILEGAGELISPQTAATLLSANEQGKMLCAATAALLEGPLSKALDEVSKKRFGQLIENALKAFALSSQVISEITATDDNDDDQEGDDGDDGLGDDGAGDGDADAASDEEAGEDEGVDE